jgi:group I intron endonuclease
MGKSFKYHFIYKTINLIDNSFYIGHHSSHNLDDPYLGSSLALKNDIKTLGSENFKREILELCENSEMLGEREKFWILETRALFSKYNKHLKGTGQKVGFKHSEETKKFFKENCRDISGDKNPMFERYGELNPNFGKGLKGEDHPMYGKNHSEETKLKQRIVKLGKYDGDKNPFFGKHHSEETKEISRQIKIEYYKTHENARKGVSACELTKSRLKESWKSREELTCPHCGLKSKSHSNMKRYHFDNCKFKNN